MKIIVPVKHVPEPGVAWQFAEDLTLDRGRLDGRLSELDEHAIEQAVQLVEGGLPATITFLTMGPASAEEALRKALALGGDEGVHVRDDALRGSDALATSLVLARAVERIGFDLVVCGMASTDGGMAVVPAMLAERLGVPQVTFGDSLRVEDDKVVISRDAAVATAQVVAAMPAVVSVTDQTGEARYPSFKAIMAGKRKPITTWTLADLGIDPDVVGLAGSATKVRSVAEQPARQAGTVIVDEGDAAARIADFLVDQKLL
jgi:electron transfer flavoprotein beta subunit